MNNLNNKELVEAVGVFAKERKDPKALLNLTRALLSNDLLVPVRSDIAPTENEKGELKVTPDMKIEMLGIRSKEGDVFFPMFTTIEEAHKIYDAPDIYLVALDFKHYMPFVMANKENVKGIVIDPKGVNVPLPNQFLHGVNDAVAKTAQRIRKPGGLNQNVIKKGEKIHLRNPQGNHDKLEAALISQGFNEEKINRIYLKERVLDPENPQAELRWFVVVDATEPDPEIFKRIGEACKEVRDGKEMEFIFSNQRLGADIAASSKPVYEKISWVI